jgi:hypothetical protein
MASPTSGQKLAVLLAFVAAALSLVSALMSYTRNGQVDAMPIFGGLLMLALGVSGWRRLRNEK